ncbi:magnesium transporter MgtE N-terminal domain-containing protein [Aquiflexum sp.]|uniref:magnesium transporter MgtE N-terminal domain-containing protein n=1 Tax=Aquiflexum sp. TaxID=1872584 RepID=UPI0035949010
MSTDHLLIYQFLQEHSNIAIPMIERLEVDEITALIEDLDSDQAVIILAEIAPFIAGKVMEKLSKKKAIELIELLDPQIAESILQVTDKSISDQLLEGTSKALSSYLRHALMFAKDQVGAHLEPYVFTLSDRMTVQNALTLVKSSKAPVRPHVYVLNDNNKLVGYIKLVELLKADPETEIHSLMEEVPRTVLASMNTSDLLESWAPALIDMPVIKLNGTFLGTVSRASLSKLEKTTKKVDHPAIKAGNALGDLYLIGLTSLLGRSSDK